MVNLLEGAENIFHHTPKALVAKKNQVNKEQNARNTQTDKEQDPNKSFNEMLVNSMTSSKDRDIDQSKNLSQDLLTKETMNIIKLFLTELQMQDPFNTMEPSDMLAQIASIFSVQETGKVNKNLEKLIEISNSNNQAYYIGKNVLYNKADGKFGKRLENGKMSINYELDNPAKNLNIIIRNENDVLVKSVLMSVEKGANEFVWNGLDNSGNLLQDGKYKISINANDGLGSVVKVTNRLNKKVLSSFKENDKIKLILEDNEIIDLSEVQGVLEESKKEVAKDQPNTGESKSS